MKYRGAANVKDFFLVIFRQHEKEEKPHTTGFDTFSQEWWCGYLTQSNSFFLLLPNVRQFRSRADVLASAAAPKEEQDIVVRNHVSVRKGEILAVA